MNFSELLAEVYGLTNRPDLVTKTKSAVKAATLKAHRLDFFAKDIYETGLQFPVASFRQQLDYASLISNWRAIKYLKRVESATDDVGVFFTVITPEELLDSYGAVRTDIAYVAGRVIELRASVEFQYMLVGAYVLPVITETGYSSWIADLYPYAIVYEATRTILKDTGQIEEANAYQKLLKRVDQRDAPGEYDMIIADEVSVVGY